MTGLRLKLETSARPMPIREVEQLLRLVADASSTVKVLDGGEWHRVDFRVADLRIGSVDLLIVAAGGVVATWKGLPALLTLMQGLRDWGDDRRIKQSEARTAEADARKAEAEATILEKEVSRRHSEEQMAEEVQELLAEINTALLQQDAGIWLPSITRSAAAMDLARLALIIESVEPE
jgi:hypothetical protein